VLGRVRENLRPVEGDVAELCEPGLAADVEDLDEQVRQRQGYRI
jgi:hypothetical protein